MECPACLAPTRESDRFCARCGAALADHLPAIRALGTAEQVKLVTLLRVDIVGSTSLVDGLGAERGFRRFEPALAVMREAIRAGGGIVCRDLGDGVLGLFGAPRARDDHAIAACRAALDLRLRIAELRDEQIAVRIGLHSAEVLTHVRTMEFSVAFDVGGTPLHLCERVQAAAEPGSILASEDCKRLADGPIRFEPMPSQALRGFAEPVNVYRVVGTKNLAGLQTRLLRGVSPFVGREAELALLDEAASRASSGQLQLLVLEGEPGIGKSRLAGRFVERMMRSGWNHILVANTPLSKSIAFSALRELLRALPLGPYGQHQVPGEAVPLRFEDLPELQRAAIDSILDQQTNSPRWLAADALSQRQAIGDASVEVVSRSIEAGRTILVVEDLQWVDPASAAVFELLMQRLSDQQILVLGTARLGERPAWVDRSAARRLPLNGLDSGASHSLLQALTGGMLDDPALEAKLLRHTGAVPYFMEEVCRHIAFSHGAGGLDPLAALGVPPTVQGLIAMRIDSVGRDERDLLQIAAALGTPCTFERLQGLLNVPARALRARVGALDSAHLLLELDDGVVFPHELVRQVAYDSMPASTRVDLHRQILHALERLSLGGMAELARHAVLAEQWEKAFDLSRKVAQHSMARSALVDATQQIEVAISSLDRMPFSLRREQQAVDLRIESRVAYSALGRVDRWLELADEAARRAAGVGDKRREIAARAVRASAMNFYGSAGAAIQEGQEAYDLAAQLDDPGWRAFSAYGLGQAYYVGGRFAAASELFGRTLDFLEQPGCTAPVGNSLATTRLMAWVMKALAEALAGDIEGAARAVSIANAQASASDRPFDRVAAGLAEGVWRLARGDVEAARAALEEAARLGQAHNVRLFLPIILCHLSAAMLAAGDAASALKTARRSFALADEVGHISARVRSALYMALAERVVGLHDEALSHVRDVRQEAHTFGFAAVEAEAVRAEAEMVSNAGERERFTDRGGSIHG